MARRNHTEELIAYLKQQNDYQTAKDISKALNVSAKTIYRAIEELNSSKTEPCISVKRGKGIRLNYKSYLLAASEVPKEQEYISDFTPIERRNKILYELLLNAPRKRKIRDVFAPFFVSESVIWADEKQMAKFLQDFSLDLHIKNGSIYISGDEKYIRKALSELITNRQTMDLMEFISKEPFNNSYDVRFVLRQIEYIEKSLGADIPYPYNVNLFTHLYILLSRLRTTASISSYSSAGGSCATDKEHEICQAVVKNMEAYLVRPLPPGEEQNLYQYLQSSRLSNAQTIEPISLSETEENIIDTLMERFAFCINGKSGNALTFLTPILRKRITTHIKPMLNRLRNDIQIKNAILNQIIDEYPLFFKATRQAVDSMVQDRLLPPITNDEVGYIALYFAQAAESIHRKVRAVIMCTTGIGTAALLEMKIKRYFPQIQIIATIASDKIKQVLAEQQHIDLVISTVKFSEPQNIPIIVVSALMSTNDKKLIENTLKEFRYV